MRRPAPAVVAALLALALAGIPAGASVQISDPVMEEFRGYVAAAGIPDWPVTYRGHILYVTALRTEYALIPHAPCEGCEAQAPEVSYELVYDRSQFEVLNETVDREVYAEPTANGTAVAVTVTVQWLLWVRLNASVFEVEDWSGNYSREQVYVEWTVARYYYYYDNETQKWLTFKLTSTYEDHPDPEHLRIYARQPRLGLDSWVEVAGDPSACNWSAATLLLHVRNPGLGIPPPGDPYWGLLANLTPGQLIIEGLRLEVAVSEPDGDVVGTLEWAGDLRATVDESMEFNATPRDPLAHRRVVVDVSALAYWDEPGGPALEPVEAAPSAASLPWTWILVRDAPAPVVYASSRVDGAAYNATGPWPARLCLPPGSYEVKCDGCMRLWLVVADPVSLTLPPEPGGAAPAPPQGPPPGAASAWLIAALASVLGYAALRILLRGG